MHEVQLQGNLGTIDLPDNWRLSSVDPTNGALVAEGPDHALISRGALLYFNTPAFFASLPRVPGMKLPPATDYLPPMDALQYLTRLTQQPGSPVRVKITKVLAQQDLKMPPPPFGGRFGAKIIGAEEAVQKNGASFDVDELTLITTYDISQTAWGGGVDGLSCEKSKFGKMLPTLLEIFASYRVNQEQVAENLKAQGKAMSDQAAILHKASDDRFATIMGTAAEREKARHASAMDTVEMLRGTRSVYDEKMGTLSDVDLNNSTGIVNALNGSAGYQRFHEVPLRDQQ